MLESFAGHKKLRRALKFGKEVSRSLPDEDNEKERLLDLQIDALYRSSISQSPLASDFRDSSKKVFSTEAKVVRDLVLWIQRILLKELPLSAVEFTPASSKINVNDESCRFFSLSNVIYSLGNPNVSNSKAAAFQLLQPTKVAVVGSAAWGPICTFHKNIDISFEIPTDVLHHRDYINYRYMAKRAAYVEAVAEFLDKKIAFEMKLRNEEWSKMCSEYVSPVVSIRPWRCDNVKPYVLLNFELKGNIEDRQEKHFAKRMQEWEFRILPSCPAGVFKEHSLRPAANAVRLTTTAFCKTSKEASACSTDADFPGYSDKGFTQDEILQLPPTSYYNGMILEDMRIFVMSSRIAEWSERFHHYSAALVLLKAWAKRRAFFSSCLSERNIYESGVCGTVLAQLLGHICLCQADVTTDASPIQLLKLVLTFLASWDVGSSYYIIGQRDAETKPPLTTEAESMLRAAVLSRNQGIQAMRGIESKDTSAFSFGKSSQKSSTGNVDFYQENELCYGLVEEAQLFDTEELDFNVLWRSQLHIKELQEEARLSLLAMRESGQGFENLFGAAQEQLVLKTDVLMHFVLSESRQHPRLFAPASAYPVADYPAPPIVICRDDFRSVSGEQYCKYNEIDLPKWEDPQHYLFAAMLCRLTVRGLRDRLRSIKIRFLMNGDNKFSSKWPCASRSAFSRVPSLTVMVMIGLQSKAATRVLDKGLNLINLQNPCDKTAAEAVAISAFKSFYGRKCELRRFQDGRLLHCVMWDASRPAGHQLIEPWHRNGCPKNSEKKVAPHELILEYVFSEYAAQFKQSMVIGTSLEMNKEAVGSLVVTSCPFGTINLPDSRHTALIKAFGELKTIFCSLSSLPLAIKQIWHTTPTMRNAEPNGLYIRDSDEEGTFLEDIVMQFENSGRWPKETEAIKKLKTAFLIRLHEELLRDCGISSHVMPEWLNLKFKGFIFRIFILHADEHTQQAAVLNANLDGLHWAQTLKQDSGQNDSAIACTDDNDRLMDGFMGLRCRDLLLGICDDEEALLAASEGRALCGIESLRKLWWRPQVNSALELLSVRYRAFSGTCRIVSLWLGAMWVVGARSICEHILAYIFIDSKETGLLDEPQTPHVGFLRFIHFLSIFPFDKEPLMVSLNPHEELKTTLRNEMQGSYDKARLFPSIHSVFDPHSILIPRCSDAAFRRLVHLAKKSYKMISSGPLGISLPSLPDSVFSLDQSQFDLIIYVNDPLSVKPKKDVHQFKRKKFSNRAFDTVDSASQSFIANLISGYSECTEDSKQFPAILTPNGTGCGLEKLLLQICCSKACIRRLLFSQFLGMISVNMPGATLIGYNTTEASLVAGGLPHCVGIKIHPEAMIHKPPQVSASAPMLYIPSEGSVLPHDKVEEKLDKKIDSATPVSIPSPVMIIASFMSFGEGLVEKVSIC